MPIRVQYNPNVKFRRQAAFRNFYRARNSRVRFAVELAMLCAALIVCAVIWSTRTPAALPNYIFYACALLVIFLFWRVVRMLFALRRVKPLGELDSSREYHFFDNGFRFGPINVMGEMLETRWREVDHAYRVGNVVYLLCKNKSQWAPVDLSRVLEGDADELVELLQKNITGKRFSK